MLPAPNGLDISPEGIISGEQTVNINKIFWGSILQTMPAYAILPIGKRIWQYIYHVRTMRKPQRSQLWGFFWLVVIVVAV